MTDSTVTSPPAARRRIDRTGVLPLGADLACILVFVALGRESHDATGRAAWFFEVWWPLAIGMVVGGVASGVYAHRGRWPLRVVGMVAIAVLIGGPLRTLTDREMFNAFTVVAFLVLSALTLGWRTVVLLVRRAR
jgi:Protein of unknown function (DUF3054)